MRQWRSLVALHSSAPSCLIPQHPSPSPCPSPPREQEEDQAEEETTNTKRSHQQQMPAVAAVVRIVGCDGRVRTYRRPVTARELMQQHPRHLVCRSDALLIGEKIPAVAPAEELQPGHAYFLLPAHLFHSVLSFVSLASSLLLLLSTSSSPAAASHKAKHRPFELHRTAAGTLQIKLSDDFLLLDDDAVVKEEEEQPPAKPAVLRGDEKLKKDYDELVGYGKARRWAPKLETIQEVVVAAAAAAASSAPAAGERRKGRSLPFLGRLGSRRRRETTTTLVCGSASAVACSG